VITLEHARIVAEAENELALIREAKRALIDYTDIFGSFKTPRFFPSDQRKHPWPKSTKIARHLPKDKDPSGSRRKIFFRQRHKRNLRLRPSDMCCQN
jgi:hypothetical protein